MGASWVRCADAWKGCLTRVAGRIRPIGSPISGWQRSRRFSCRARRFSIFSGGLKTTMPVRIARPYSIYPRSLRITGSGTCSIQRSRICFIRFLPKSVAILEGMNGGLDKFRRLGKHVLIALDGTEYFTSKKIHCQNCSTRQRGKGEKEYFRRRQPKLVQSSRGGTGPGKP